MLDIENHNNDGRESREDTKLHKIIKFIHTTALHVAFEVLLDKILAS